MKILKRVIAVILSIILFVGSFVGSFLIFNKGTYEIKTEYLSIFDEKKDTYYLQKADKNIIFRVDLDASFKKSGYSLTDYSGNPVVTKTQRVLGNSFNILPPENGYEEGQRYILTLPDNASFHDNNIKNARVLIFCIEREETATYKFSDSVVETNKTITQINENTISLGDEFAKNDIVFGKNHDNQYVAYKISEITDDGKANITIPALDEIYSELDVYGEYQWDVEEFTANPDIEVEIIENVKNSSFFDSLMLTAYAEESPRDGKFDVKITPDGENNSLAIEIKITLEPGENGLFGIAQLKNQQVSLTLSAKLGLKTKCNIDGVTTWDISASITTGFSWTVEISLYTDEWKKDSDLEGLFSKDNKATNLIDYHKNVQKITDKLNQISADATSGEIKLFDWKLPIPTVPGLYFSAEVKLFAKFEIAADIVIGQNTETVYTVGVCFVNKKFDTYSNTYRSGDDIQLSLSGKAKAKAGIKLVIKASLISDKIANINLDPQVGLYADLYVTIPIANKSEINDDTFLYSYFEPGAYFSANVNALLNIAVKKFEFSYELVEKKFPIDALTFGNKKIAIGLTVNTPTVRAVNNTISLPDVMFEYFDVKKGVNSTEKISTDKLKFVSNEGTKLTVKNGKITLPEASSTNSMYITATYINTDGKSYSTIFRVLISGSIIEGKVSAYTDDLSTGELEGATVKLYGSTNKETPISNVTTDESGKFSFNVSKGNYTLVISAEGYRTLTSNQSVADDEIKYTEHILLMDDMQTGNGSAGGTVSNALDGKGLNGVKLKLRNNWNNTTGAYVENFETITNSSGKYTVSNVPVGYYTIEASLDGYVTGHSNIIVLSDSAKEDFDFTITPHLSNDEIRIVLTWGSTPSDLDSHLIGKTPSGNSFNVYYSDKVYNYDGFEMANLDVDDTSSYGPETITILKNIHGVYTYAVHNYSNKNSTGSSALSFSGAVVRVFKGSTQVAEYNVPTDQIGTYWTVFQINSAGHILPINSISNNKPIAE